MFKEYSVIPESESVMMDFIVQHTPFIQDENTPTLIWCDEEHKLGVDIHNGNSNIKFYYNNTSDNIAVGNSFPITHGPSSTPNRIFIQKSKKETVYYLGSYNGSDTTYCCNLVFAKDKTGEWNIINSGTVRYANGTSSFESVGVSPDYNLPFSARRVYKAATDTDFEELYRIETATIFSLRGTYVNFDKQGYRVVFCGKETPADSKPYYAFPVADEI